MCVAVCLFFVWCNGLICVVLLLFSIPLTQYAGAKCVGDFNYYLSFTIMFCLPVSIVVAGAGMYCYKVRSITHKLNTMTVEEKVATKKDAFHQLFRIVSIYSKTRTFCFLTLPNLTLVFLYICFVGT